MSWFVLLSWMFCAVISLSLIGLLYKEKYLGIKPSFLFVAFFNFQIQWGSAVNASRIEQQLQNPWHYFYLTHLFPCVVLLLSCCCFNRSASLIYNRLKLATKRDRLKSLNMLILLLVIQSIFILLWYLNSVSWSETGLYAIINDPKNYLLKREASMKLLKDPILAYGVSALQNIIAPILATMLCIKIFDSYRRFNPISLMVYSGFVIGLLFTVTIYGARGPGAMLILSVCYTIYVLNDFPLNPIKITVAVILVMALPTFLVILYNEVSFDFGGILQGYGNIFDRVFNRNIDAGVWAVNYVQNFGYFGINGIPKLAVIVGEKPIDIFNVVGTYNRPEEATISATCAYVFAYYSCFGLAVFVPCVFLAIITDMLLLLYRTFPSGLLLACLSATSIAIAKLPSTFYTTVLITGGAIDNSNMGNRTKYVFANR